MDFSSLSIPEQLLPSSAQHNRCSNKKNVYNDSASSFASSSSLSWFYDGDDDSNADDDDFSLDDQNDACDGKSESTLNFSKDFEELSLQEDDEVASLSPIRNYSKRRSRVVVCFSTVQIRSFVKSIDFDDSSQGSLVSLISHTVIGQATDKVESPVSSSDKCNDNASANDDIILSVSEYEEFRKTSLSMVKTLFLIKQREQQKKKTSIMKKPSSFVIPSNLSSSAIAPQPIMRNRSM